MLNYLKAELYKVLRQRWFCFGLSLLLLLEGLLVFLLWLSGAEWNFNQSVVLLCGLLPFGFFLVYPLGSTVFSEQYKYDTLKNELSFGLPRRRAYLGKLLAEVLVCLAVCLLAVAFFLGFSLLAFPVAAGGGLGDDLLTLGYCLLLALPVWLGGLGLLHALQFTIKSAAAVAIVYGAFFLLFEPTVYMFSEFTHTAGNRFFAALHQGMLSTPLGGLAGYLGPERMGWGWLVGLGWLVATTLVGLAIFQKRDIK